MIATSAPCCSANACWNGLLESASRARLSVADAVDTSSTRKITMVCVRRRVTPPDAALMTGRAFMTAPS